MVATRAHRAVLQTRISYERHCGCESSPVDLRDDVFWDTVSLCIPSSGDLSRDEAIKLDGLGDQHPRALLELDFPFARLGEPNVHLVALFSLESSSIVGRYFERFEIVVELDLLVEDFALRVISAKQLGFCEQVSYKIWIQLEVAYQST